MPNGGICPGAPPGSGRPETNPRMVPVKLLQIGPGLTSGKERTHGKTGGERRRNELQWVRGRCEGKLQKQFSCCWQPSASMQEQEGPDSTLYSRFPGL